MIHFIRICMTYIFSVNIQRTFEKEQMGDMEIVNVKKVTKMIEDLLSLQTKPPDAELWARLPEQTRWPVAKFAQRIHRRSRLAPNVLALVLIYLQRFVERHPNIQAFYGGGHRLCFTAMMVASKMQNDVAYTNRVWGKIAYNIFSLREINVMEREFLKFLEFELFVGPAEWDNCLKIINETD